MEKAMFGAGCFWGVEEAFRRLDGVVETAVGYSGGNFPSPTYEDVCRGNTGHAEVVEVTFDPAKISYGDLLKVLWAIHDPTTSNRQGPDIGSQYRSAIFYYTADQEKAARDSKEAMEKSGTFPSPIVTEITEASAFNRAEEYHQQYYAKRGISRCGG